MSHFESEWSLNVGFFEYVVFELKKFPSGDSSEFFWSSFADCPSNLPTWRKFQASRRKSRKPFPLLKKIMRFFVRLNSKKKVSKVFL